LVLEIVVAEPGRGPQLTDLCINKIHPL
jgi:hypothetical protein